MTTQHTPTPWTIDDKGVVAKGIFPRGNGQRRIATCKSTTTAYPTPEIDAENVANAAFIVRACNAWPYFETALQKVEGFRGLKGEDLDRAIELHPGTVRRIISELLGAIGLMVNDEVQASIAKAEGK